MAKEKKIDPNSKAYKYYKAREAGKNKQESALVAGYSPNTAKQPQAIEKTKDYQLVASHFKDVLSTKITMGEIADSLVDNIKQESSPSVDRGARNKAIEIAVKTLEPENHQDDEKVLIILK